MTTITGRVVDARGQPVAGVPLELRAQRWRGQVWRARTDENGETAFVAPQLRAVSSGKLTVNITGSSQFTPVPRHREFTVRMPVKHSVQNVRSRHQIMAPPPQVREIMAPHPQTRGMTNAGSTNQSSIAGQSPLRGTGTPGEGDAGFDLNPEPFQPCETGCFDLPYSCIPRGWSADSPNWALILDLISQWNKVKAKIKDLQRKPTATNTAPQIEALKAAYLVTVKRQMAIWHKLYEQWSNAEACQTCKANQALMSSWVKTCCAAWVESGNVGVAGNGLTLAPSAFSHDEKWFPSMMGCTNTVYVGKKMVPPNDTKSLIPIVVAIRRDTDKRVALLSAVLQARAWRSLPNETSRRFWARMFGDTVWCGMKCACDQPNGTCSDPNSTYIYTGKGTGVDGECSGPPITWAFDLPPILYEVYPGNSEVLAPDQYGYGPWPKSQKDVGGSPLLMDGSGYKSMQLYVAVVPVVADEAMRSITSPIQPATASCRLVRPADLTSPDTEEVQSWTSLATKELSKWTTTQQAWPKPQGWT